MSVKSELRQDLTSGDWILFSPKRKHRLKHLRVGSRIIKQPKKTCVFEDPKKAGGGKLISSYPSERNWKLQIVPNKYPAVKVSKEKARVGKEGPFSMAEGYGHHELAITKSHDNNFPKLSIVDANLLFGAFQDRYQEIAEDKNTAYISIFHNWGPKAAATIYHPHYQILSTPVVPPKAEVAISHARRYRRKKKKCIHCFQIEVALKDGQRVIHEDELSIAFAPFAPREPFEFRVSPKGHSPHFEDASEYEIHSMVKSLQASIRKLEGKLKNVNYNFYIHTAPVKRKDNYGFYHWHVEVIPREILPHMGMTGGFELTTGIEINPFYPEDAVKILNSK